MCYFLLNYSLFFLKWNLKNYALSYGLHSSNSCYTILIYFFISIFYSSSVVMFYKYCLQLCKWLFVSPCVLKWNNISSQNLVQEELHVSILMKNFNVHHYRRYYGYANYICPQTICFSYHLVFFLLNFTESYFLTVTGLCMCE